MQSKLPSVQRQCNIQRNVRTADARLAGLLKCKFLLLIIAASPLCILFSLSCSPRVPRQERQRCLLGASSTITTHATGVEWTGRHAFVFVVSSSRDGRFCLLTSTLQFILTHCFNFQDRIGVQSSAAEP